MTIYTFALGYMSVMMILWLLAAANLLSNNQEK